MQTNEDINIYFLEKFHSIKDSLTELNNFNLNSNEKRNIHIT